MPASSLACSREKDGVVWSGEEESLFPLYDTGAFWNCVIAPTQVGLQRNLSMGKEQRARVYEN
jgi:hypothetical protein